MIIVSGNALIGPELKHTKEVRIQINNEGTIIDISNEEGSSDYELPSSYILVYFLLGKIVFRKISSSFSTNGIK